MLSSVNATSDPVRPVQSVADPETSEGGGKKHEI